MIRPKYLVDFLAICKVGIWDLVRRMIIDREFPYSSSHACKNLHMAWTAFPAEFAVALELRDGKVPTKKGSFRSGILVREIFHYW